MEFQPGQLVRVARQPEKMHVRIQGEVAFIEEVKTFVDGETWAVIRALRIDGEGAGGGSVPVTCLDPCTDPVWVAAHETFKRNWARWTEEVEIRTAKYRAAHQEALRLTAEEFGLEPVLVEKVVTAFNSRKPD